jgi:hypothetical protein
MNLEITERELKKNGFQGFITIGHLFNDRSKLPKEKGVYMILIPSSFIPKFKTVGTGGYFKGKNPNLTLEELQNNWVENESIIYIGKAGSETGSATLKSRLNQYLNFGQGKAVGHWGGRLIWQLQNSENLIVCWKTTQGEEPSKVESKLIESFKAIHNKRPFANLRD